MVSVSAIKFSSPLERAIIATLKAIEVYLNDKNEREKKESK